MHPPLPFPLFVSPTKKAFKQLAEKHDLVYFGSVSQHEDEHEMVRGITLSPYHHDSHYCVGSVHGRDLIALERKDRLALPDQPEKMYTWLILQIDLSVDTLPHSFFDGHHHDETFYGMLYAKFARFSKLDHSLFMDHDPLFTERFTLFTPPDASDNLLKLLTPEVTATLAHHFSQFDFEIFQDHVIVYNSEKNASIAELERMLRAGTWLSGQLEAAAKLSL